jgi:hypothetical protein
MGVDCKIGTIKIWAGFQLAHFQEILCHTLILVAKSHFGISSKMPLGGVQLPI